MSQLTKLFDGLTMEATFVEETKRRTQQYMIEQLEEVKDLIALIHLDHGQDQSKEECQRFRRVYALLVDKINSLKTGEAG